MLTQPVRQGAERGGREQGVIAWFAWGHCVYWGVADASRRQLNLLEIRISHCFAPQSAYYFQFFCISGLLLTDIIWYSPEWGAWHRGSSTLSLGCGHCGINELPAAVEALETAPELIDWLMLKCNRNRAKDTAETETEQRQKERQRQRRCRRQLISINYPQAIAKSETGIGVQNGNRLFILLSCAVSISFAASVSVWQTALALHADNKIVDTRCSADRYKDTRQKDTKIINKMLRHSTRRYTQPCCTRSWLMMVVLECAR